MVMANILKCVMVSLSRSTRALGLRASGMGVVKKLQLMVLLKVTGVKTNVMA
jgi:hypothetical protein